MVPKKDKYKAVIRKMLFQNPMMHRNLLSSDHFRKAHSPPSGSGLLPPASVTEQAQNGPAHFWRGGGGGGANCQSLRQDLSVHPGPGLRVKVLVPWSLRRLTLGPGG